MSRGDSTQEFMTRRMQPISDDAAVGTLGRARTKSLRSEVADHEGLGRRDFLRVAAASAATVAAMGDVHAQEKVAPPADKHRSMSYIELLHDCYKDELWGSRVFEMTIALRPMAGREQSLLSVLAITERSMQGHLEFVLRRHGQRWDERVYAAEADSVARGFASQIGKLPWQAFNLGFEQAIPPYLTKYQLLRDNAPPQDREIMDLFVEHEAAYLSLAKMEQIYENEASLGPVWRTLERSQRMAAARGS